MKDLLKYLKPYKRECVLAPLFKMLEAIFELFVPLVVASIIDKGIGAGDKSHIIKCCAVMISLGLVGLISAVSAQYMAARAAVGFSAGLRHDLFKHIMSLSHGNIDELGTSTMITRMTADVNQAQTGVNMFLRLFLRSPFIVFGAMIMAFTINVRAALIFVVAITMLFAVVGFIMNRNIPMLKEVQKKLDRIMLLARENLTGARVIRAFTLEEGETEGFLASNDALFVEQRRAGHLSAALNPLTYILINLAIVILIYVGALKVDAGILTRGQVVALYNYMSQILVELIKLANLIVLLNKALASGGRVADVFGIQSDIRDIFTETMGDASMDLRVDREAGDEDPDQDAGQGEDFVSFDHVDLKYNKTGDDALSDIDFSVKKGETVGIIGGTGSGKSSVVNLIPRFYDVSGGSVKVSGRDVRNLSLKKLRNMIGIVPQKAVLFKGTIGDNLRWGNEEASDEELMEAVRLAVCEEVVEGKGGLSGMVEQGGRNLSGGQRQRLTIARALVRKPEILILDDSASALDYATDLKLRKNIAGIGYGPTVFIVSQRTAAVMNADKIIVLEDGCIVGMGKHDDLLKSCGVYKEIYNSNTA
ncbi:MAG: ABC transporter ATP-binding protein/permease [Lachnospiraceae bacterium]|nr:ABC transporter ATP-binding protein/permease [Lachnospiraceae bacterium]